MLTWKTVDRANWKNREVPNDEPDKAHWAAHGFDCLIVRGPSGALCGYVGVPPGHPAFEQYYETVDVEVHGGLTFADRCAPNANQERSICHMDEFAVHKTVWWLGFDCAHCDDLCPAYMDQDYINSTHCIYRDFNYVQREVESLAKQLMVAA